MNQKYYISQAIEWCIIKYSKPKALFVRANTFSARTLKMHTFYVYTESENLLRL